MDTLFRTRGQNAAQPGSGLNMIFYPEDAKRFLKWGALGFVGLGVYQMFMTVAKRNINPSVEFEDPVESMNCDPIIRDAFIHIQPYRKLNPWLYKTALQNADQLLFLENVLLSQEASAQRNDKVCAWSHFRMAVNRLNQFQFLVRERMGNDHGMAVNIFVKKIYEQLKKHVLNVLHLCSDFRPDRLIARAPMEVEQALQNYERGIRPVSSDKKWKRLKRKLDRYEGRDRQRRSPDEIAVEAKETSRRSRRSRRSNRSRQSRYSRHSRHSRKETKEVTKTNPHDRGIGLGQEE